MAVVDQRARDLARRGQQVVLDPARAGAPAPRPPRRPRRAPAAGAHPAAARAPAHASASSARLQRENSGEVTVSRRGRPAAGSARHLGPYASRARGQHQHAVAEVERLLDVVGHEQDRARLGREAAAATPASRARVIESSEPKGSSSSRRACRPAACAGTRPAGASRPTARPGRAAREPRQAEALEQRRHAPARLAARARPRARAPARRCRAPSARAAAGRAAASARSARAGRRRQSARRRAIAPGVGSSSPATISSRVDLPQPDGPTMPSTSPRRTRANVVERRRARRGAASNVSRARRRHGRLGPGPFRLRLLLGSPPRSSCCSLRGHYPTGSKGQRRERHLRRDLSPLAREPP